MTDRPILFSAPMVRALLDGSKTQTRRLAWRGSSTNKIGIFAPTIWKSVKPGDRLWVRETFLTVGGRDPERARVVYAASNDGADAWVSPSWSPSIHMPRWASRITLVVTATKMEQVQEISEEDAKAERAALLAYDNTGILWNVPPPVGNYPDGFQSIWRKLHRKAPNRWEDNPEVVALTFTAHQQNIDAMGEAA